MSGVLLVQFSNLDIKKFLRAGRQSLDRNLAQYADAANYEPPLHHMLCIASLKNPDAKSASDVKPYMGLFQVGFLIASDESYWAEILELAGMPCIMVETIERGINVGFIVGDLLQWQSAILRGCQKEISREVRHTYNLIFTEFKNIGLSPLFDFKSRTNTRDHTFLLEYNKP